MCEGDGLCVFVGGGGGEGVCCGGGVRGGGCYQCVCRVVFMLAPPIARHHLLLPLTLIVSAPVAQQTSRFGSTQRSLPANSIQNLLLLMLPLPPKRTLERLLRQSVLSFTRISL